MRRALIPSLVLAAALAFACGDALDDEAMAQPTPTPTVSPIEVCLPSGSRQLYGVVGAASICCPTGEPAEFEYGFRSILATCP